MEPDVPQSPDAGAPSDRPEAARADWRALSHLRDRVEAAAREIERLRAENAALVQRVASLQDAREGAPSFSFGSGEEDTAALKARVQRFIDTIDGLLRGGGDGAPADTPDDA